MNVIDTINILIIEENFDYKSYIEGLLDGTADASFKFHITQANTLEDGIKFAMNGNFDVVLLDLELPDSNGPKTFEEFVENVNNIPVVVITELYDSDAEITLINIGSQGFIKKNDITIDNLKSSVTHSIARFGFFRDLIVKNERTEKSSLKINERLSDLLKNKINNYSEREWFEKNYVNILIVDDEMVNLMITKKILSQNGYKCTICKSGEEAVELVKKENFSLALLDIQMGGMDGYETCVKLKKIKPEIYVIMLTGTVSNDSIKKSYSAGAMDFARKQFDNMELVVRVENAIRIMHSEIALKYSHEIISEKNGLLEKLIITDNMTKVYTRNYVIKCLETNIYNGARYHQPLSLIMLDFDHFKQINDKFGHIAGDQAIMKLAEIVKKSLRKTDIVGRYGGDEFIILLPFTNIAGGIAKAEIIRNNVKKINFSMAPGLEITVSIGVCEFIEEKNPDELINKADELLYRAKENGRNRIES